MVNTPHLTHVFVNVWISVAVSSYDSYQSVINDNATTVNTNPKSAKVRPNNNPAGCLRNC